MKIKIGYHKKMYKIDVEENGVVNKYEFDKLEKLEEFKNSRKVEILLELSMYKVTINKFPSIKKGLIEGYMLKFVNSNYKDYIIFDKFLIKKKDNVILTAFLVKKNIYNTLKKIFHKVKITCLFNVTYYNLLKKYPTNIYLMNNEMLFCIDNELFYNCSIEGESIEKICDYISRGLYGQLFSGKLYILSNKGTYSYSKQLIDKLAKYIEEKVELIEMSV